MYTYFSTQRLAFINLDMNVGYDQISHQVSSHLSKFELSVDLEICSIVRAE